MLCCNFLQITWTLPLIKIVELIDTNFGPAALLSDPCLSLSDWLIAINLLILLRLDGCDLAWEDKMPNQQVLKSLQM